MTWNPLRARRDRDTRRIVAVLLALPEDRHFGWDLSRMAGVSSGSMYPILTDMMTRSWLDDGWEDPPVDRRPRRYYMVNAKGRAEMPAIVRGSNHEHW